MQVSTSKLIYKPSFFFLFLFEDESNQTPLI
jgi:hypothetical protein